MSKSVLDPKGYGRKIYERFPRVYKREDETHKYTLRRYLDAIGDGVEPFIEDANGLLTFYDPIKSPSKVLPYVFSSFGLEIFHGIPDLYVRNLLPLIGQLYKRKGTFDVVEYLTEVITDSKVTVEVMQYDEIRAYFGEAIFGRALLGDGSGKTVGILVTIEVDYGNSRDILPDRNQILRIIREFVPFYCLVIVRYAYVYDDKAKLVVKEGWHDYLYHLTDENPYIRVTESGIENLIQLDYKEDIFYPNIRNPRSTAVIGEGKLGYMLFSGHADNIGHTTNSTMGEGTLGYMVLRNKPRTKGRRGALLGRARLGEMAFNQKIYEWNTIQDSTLGVGRIGDAVMGIDYTQWMRYVIKAPFQIEDTRMKMWEKRREQLILEIREKYGDEIADYFDTSLGYFGLGKLGEMLFGKSKYGKSGYFGIGHLGRALFGSHRYGKLGRFGLGQLGNMVFGETGASADKSGYLGLGQLGRMVLRYTEANTDGPNNGDYAKFFANEVKSDIVGHYVEEEADRFIATGYLPLRSAVFKGGQPLGKSVIGVNQPYTSVDYTVDEIIYSDGSKVEIVVD